MAKYGIWAVRSANSICGYSAAWLKADGKPLTFDSFEAASVEAARVREVMRSANVSYYAQEMEPDELLGRSGSPSGKIVQWLD
jgi:hypothetical protein